LFERNIAFCYRDSNWRRCKSRDLMLTVNTPVKLHIKVAKLKWQRRMQVSSKASSAICDWFELFKSRSLFNDKFN
jgi:hypothetical protein